MHANKKLFEDAYAADTGNNVNNTNPLVETFAKEFQRIFEIRKPLCMLVILSGTIL